MATRIAKTSPATSKPAKQPPARKTTQAAKRTRKAPAKKPDLTRRPRDFMTDGQGYAIVAALIAGIPTPHINDWRDHRDGTVTRPLDEGTLLYDVPTRTLTWQATCAMGATHTYPIDAPSTATAARIHADRCTTLHADLTHIPALTTEELVELGILNVPTWVKALPGEPVTESIPVPLPVPERVLGDQLTRSGSSTADTQPLMVDEICQHIDSQLAASSEAAKEHPEP